MSVRNMLSRKKQFYQISEHVYTYGRPGEYAPRAKRVPANSPTGAGRPSYRRIRGGEVPRDLMPLKTLAKGMVDCLLAADEVAEA